MIQTTGIGSLPHHNIDAALEYAFKWNIPFLPQIPVRHPKEYMIYQALEGMPGLILKERGEVAISRPAWEKGEKALAEKLETAFRSTDPQAFREFEPSPEAYSAWRPFLWELTERKATVAKIQIAGPMTSQWSLRLEDGTPADKFTDIGTQIFRLVLAKSIAMTRKIRDAGIEPIVFVDEPGFYCFSNRIPKHLLGLQELKIFLQTLRKEKAKVGLHCCSNTDWEAILSLELDVLSIDTSLSLGSLSENRTELEGFIQRGGTLSLGVVPTLRGSEDIVGFDPLVSVKNLFEALPKSIICSSYFTPACGLALHKVEDTERILGLIGQCVEAADQRCRT